MSKGTVLVADDDAAIRTVLTQALSRAGFDVRLTSNAASLWEEVMAGTGDVLLTDVMMPDQNVFDLIPSIRKQRPNMPIVVMSAQNTLMTAIRASELGAYEYLPKPFDLSEMVSVIQSALRSTTAKAQSQQDAQGEDLPLVGRSAVMQDIYRSIARLMQTDLTILVTGESGTGKELVARAIHDYGKRKDRPFVALNMAAIPKDLIEAELFGHEKGAFTGAQGRMPGQFEQANGGTLFLDEIGDMPMEAQTRLLRVLQEGEYTSVGGRTPIKANVRIIAATHRDLRELIAQGLFREDLYFRLNVVPLRLPPLRQRLEDIPDLTNHFMAACEKEGLGHKFIENDAMECLQGYNWPGNVRELENFVRRVCALYPEEQLTREIVMQELSLLKTTGLDEKTPLKLEKVDLSSLLTGYVEEYMSRPATQRHESGLYEYILSLIEPPVLKTCMQATRGNQLRAAEILGINRNTLRKKLRDRRLL